MHFADDLKLTPGNKMSKISPLYDITNKNFVQFDIFHSLVSIDQRFSTGVPRHPRVPFAIRWGAASYFTLFICLGKSLNAVMLF